MCIGIPVKILEVNDKEALGEVYGIKKKIRIDFLPSVKIGDYVMTHAGFALDLIKEKEANEIIDIMKTIEYHNKSI
ncbi:hydrogenase expression/formation protein HypC [Clostridium tetanomorphum]|uniref:HypC/HybG/HupF family hydrogenase formation chaperone n=1 Tax=Clostridium tetanomorphum TaxID=1553 RepID=A0A923IYR8_CLOTT|nr:HypC/HybG/HupF family hydrogenase formation chaperone [Clostridium tetanomorphum]KAJ53357.1 hydrogenase assembly chaperone HypC/HupF [Clostridium tetanomorphum DSM 665]MBC2396656.1 HypC/HybG/HupF family hydrogenase formation chaperone [Clostridium tetanomorphum]MBP1863987.1 hydrogenase expression/formation protein HypC [Clostridium tetanomorphum]NRS85065.1 hydrogenase expression/formation protein HypC [Clostridium tetanomorphum]NRZ98282.1 hydrogenase expression/formation protein HypC [Clost